jgi:hypothetical protein
VSQEIFNQILSQCNNLDETVIADVIKNLVDKLEHKEKSTLLEQLASNMSADIKAKLIKRLLGDSGFQIILGQVTATNFYNFQSSSPDYLSDVLLAIAEMIRKS